MKERDDLNTAFDKLLQNIAAESSDMFGEPIKILSSSDGLGITFSAGHEDASLHYKLLGGRGLSAERGELTPTIESWHFRKYLWFRTIVQKLEERQGTVVTLLPTSLVQAGHDAGLPHDSVVDFTFVMNGLLVKPDFARCANELKAVFSQAARDKLSDNEDYQVRELDGTYRLIPISDSAVESLKMDNEAYQKVLPKVANLHKQLKADLSLE